MKPIWRPFSSTAHQADYRDKGSRPWLVAGGEADDRELGRAAWLDETADQSRKHVKILLANSEPSAPGPIATFRCAVEFGRYRGIADIESTAPIARWRGRGSGVLGERLSATVRTTKQGVPFFDSYQTENARPIS
jgi:hypothetical protein